MGAKVPDFRGLFLRGHGAQTSFHYGMVTHQSGALGQLQGDATRNIIGHVGDVMTSGSAEVGNYTGAFYVTHHTPNSIGYGGIYSREHISSAFDASRVVPTAEEIRPVNRAVRYLMRALPPKKQPPQIRHLAADKRGQFRVCVALARKRPMAGRGSGSGRPGCQAEPH